MAEIDDVEVLARFPGLPVDRDNVAFFRGLLQRRLLINRCGDCGQWHQPPWPICPGCWSDDVWPTVVSGRGTVHSFSVLRVGHPLPGVDYAHGHPVAVVELEEQVGLRVAVALANCEPSSVSVGLPVQLCWIEREGTPIPAFEPSDGDRDP